MGEESDDAEAGAVSERVVDELGGIERNGLGGGGPAPTVSDVRRGPFRGARVFAGRFRFFFGVPVILT